MSRPIKFRVWDNDCHRFVYFEIGENDDCYGMFRVAANKFSSVIEQYTGLKDKNGKEIYENDIVKYGDSAAVIIWREENAEFGVRWLDCGVEDSISWQIGIEKTPSEVIGNIHENPELLGGGE